MNVLISYDVSTETAAGRRRLRKVAQACQDFGQRVQKSVFECSVSEAQFEEVVRRLLDIIEKTEDSLRAVSYTHLRAHETVLDLVCRLLLEKKKTYNV